VAGAGASLDFGMPSVGDIDNLFDKWCLAKCHLHKTPNVSLYRYVFSALHSYKAGSALPLVASSNPNFEEVLYTMLQLASFLDDVNRRNSTGAFLSISSLPEVMFLGQRRMLDGHVFRSVAALLSEMLIEEFRRLCSVLGTTRNAQIEELRRFLGELRKNYDVSLVTVNYDNVLGRLFVHFNTGFNSIDGAFHSNQLWNDPSWNALIHLHGSVHFSMVGDATDLHAIKWVGDISSANPPQIFGRSMQDTTEGVDYLTSMFVAGYGKPYQMRREPFLTYYAVFNRLVSQAERLLFLGYGFGDLHINAVLSQFPRTRRRKVVVVSYSNKRADPVAFGWQSVDWAWNLGRTIATDLSRLIMEGSRSPGSITELIVNKRFEISTDPDTPLAIWHGGLMDAVRNPSRILSQLR
jgi:hypothetical protein